MRAALEAVADFLSKYGAVDEAAAIMQSIVRMGGTVPENSPLRLRELISVMRSELQNAALPVDYTFLFERLLQLSPTIPVSLCRSLFSSPLLRHVLVERFEVAIAGVRAETFREQRADLWRVDGVYDACVLVRDSLFPDRSGDQPLGALLEAFRVVFVESEDPKSRWAELYRQHRICDDTAFRRDMVRALFVIEHAAVGDCAIERAFPSREPDGARAAATRASREMLTRKFGDANEQLWANLAIVHSIRAADARQKDGVHHAGADAAVAPPTDAEATTGSENERERERVEQQRPRRARRVRPVEPASNSDEDDASDAASSSAGSAAPRRRTRRKRRFWTSTEEQALLDGYAEFGKSSNVWVLIKDKYADELRRRSNVDLKDKYRNLRKYGRLPRRDA